MRRPNARIISVESRAVKLTFSTRRGKRYSMGAKGLLSRFKTKVTFPIDYLFFAFKGL